MFPEVDELYVPFLDDKIPSDCRHAHHSRRADRLNELFPCRVRVATSQTRKHPFENSFGTACPVGRRARRVPKSGRCSGVTTWPPCARCSRLGKPFLRMIDQFASWPARQRDKSFFSAVHEPTTTRLNGHCVGRELFQDAARVPTVHDGYVSRERLAAESFPKERSAGYSLRSVSIERPKMQFYSPGPRGCAPG